MANIALITNNILSDSGTAITSVLSGSGTTNYLSKFTGSTALGNSLIYDDGTNVGIGTTTPGGKLQINGSVTASSAIARSTYITSTLVAAANSDLLVGLDINNTYTNGAYTGVTNYSIRTYNKYKFETLSDLAHGLYWSPANDGTILKVYGSNYSGGMGYLQLNVLSGGDGMAVNGSSHSLSINAAQTSIGLNLNNITFNTHGTGEAMRIVNSTKNVLIGTTTDAGQKLQIAGNQATTIAGSGDGFNLTRTGAYDNTTLTALATITDTTSNANRAKTGLYVNVTSASTNIAIQTVGAVGVGVTPPSNSFASGYFSYLYAGATVNSAANYNLNVRSTISSYSAGNGGGMSFWGDDRGQAGANTAFAGVRGVKENSTYLNGLGALVFLTQASSTGLSTESTFAEVGRFTSGGNFLIGTTTDGGYKLNVNGNGNFILGNSGYIRLQSGSGQRHGYIQSAFSNFLFSNNIYYDGSNWRYDQNGYGAQIQTETLSVGVIAFNTFASGTAGNVATIIESMRIVNNGNILMGTTTDSGYKLDVNGTSRFTNSISLTGSNRYIASGSSSQGVYITGGTSYLDGAYFNLTGNTYGASPGAGSAEFVIRTNSDSKFALFGYNGSSWSRYMTLYGPTGNLNIGSGTTDSGYKLRIEGNTYNDGEIISVGNITTNASAYVNANQSGYNLTVYPDYTSGPNNLYSGGQVKANIYTSSVNSSTQISPSSNATLMNWYPSTSQAVFIDYVIWIDGPNAWRSGTFMVVNDASGNVQTTDISTPDLNASTAGVILQAANYGGTMGFVASNTTGDVVYMNIITRYIPTMF
jgi:hypothetical protein